jgi:malate dehydrogenase
MALVKRKITIIGAGHVGGTTAQRLMEKNVVREIVLLDILRDVAVGKALDLAEAAPLYGYDVDIRGTDRYAETEGSDIVVITSGVPRKPGMSRDDLLSTNAKIVSTVTEQVVRASPEAILVVVSNPLDAMTYVTHRVSRFPRERVIGMAGILDSARMASFIASAAGVSVNSVQAIVLGGHGDSMVPLPRHTTVAGVPVEQLLSKDQLETIVQRTREGGAEIVKLLKTGSAYYAPSAAIVEMVVSILLDKKKVLPCAALCRGEFGIHDLFVGVPAKLGAAGMEGIVEYELTPEEEAGLQRSAASVKDLCQVVDRLAGLTKPKSQG